MLPVLLLVVRPLAAVVALLPAGVPRDTDALIGWFANGGIGSFCYVAVALHANVLTPQGAAVTEPGTRDAASPRP